ncbi:hypothetical protein [Proteus mirabilis]|uniref:hypothetical protein n=1 Tax=Proteus mirabilis TaxID=584 RepID=UPI0034D6811B
MSSITVNDQPFDTDDVLSVLFFINSLESPILEASDGRVCTDIKFDYTKNVITFAKIDRDGNVYRSFIDPRKTHELEELKGSRVFTDPYKFNELSKSSIFLSKKGNYFITQEMIDPSKPTRFQSIHRPNDSCTIHSTSIDSVQFYIWFDVVNQLHEIKLFSIDNGRTTFEKTIRCLNDIDQEGNLILVKYTEDIAHPPFIVFIGNGTIYDIEYGYISHDFTNISHGPNSIEEMYILSNGYTIYKDLNNLDVDPSESFIPKALKITKGDDHVLMLSFVNRDDLDGTNHTCVVINEKGEVDLRKKDDGENYLISMSKFFS